MKKILMLSVGRQTYLVDLFSKYFDVVIGDNSPLTTGMYSDVKSYIMPRYDSADYARVLKRIILDDHIDYLLSLSDIEITLIAGLKNELPPTCELLMPDADISYICLDKYAFSKLLAQNGIGTPKTYLTPSEVVSAIAEGQLHYPVIGKSRWGMGSKGVTFLNNAEEMNLFYRLYKPKFSAPDFLHVEMECKEETLVFQEVVDGAEFGLDIVNDLQGQWHTTAIKQKLMMRGGETDIAEVVDNSEIEEVSRKISMMLNHKGSVDCDLLVSDAGMYVIDVNPRFGGGYMFSLAAGLDVPYLLSRWANGESLPERRIETGCVYRKITELKKLSL